MHRDPILRLSHHTEQALARPRPRLRGRSHLAAVGVMLPLAVTAIAWAPTLRLRLAVAAFGLSMTLMFAFSALLHLRRWSAMVHERLLRLDHCGIYAAIGGTAVSVGLLGLSGWPGRVLVAAGLVGVVAGVALEWLPFAPPRGLNNTIYLMLGWTPAVLLPWLWLLSGPLVVGLLVAGGVLYTVGAVVVGLRRPDPLPGLFGYHELFHALVIVAVAVHATMLGVLADRHL